MKPAHKAKFPVPGHNRRLYTDEQLAESVKQPFPHWVYQGPGCRTIGQQMKAWERRNGVLAKQDPPKAKKSTKKVPARTLAAVAALVGSK